MRRCAALALAWLGCSTPDPGNATAYDQAASDGLRAPPRPGFEPVADALQPTCGTLECHGKAERNLRLYGGRGLRLAPDDNPGDRPTTRAEYDATYWSLVGLEPEALSAVVRDGGAQPERLSLVRKARGLDHHKGGRLSVAGDALDRCLHAWLAGAIQSEPCRAVADAPRPVIVPR